MVADWHNRASTCESIRQKLAAHTSIDAQGQSFRKLELAFIQAAEYMHSLAEQYEQAAMVILSWRNSLEDMQTRAGLAWHRAYEAQQIMDDLQRRIVFDGPGGLGLEDQVMEQRWVIEAAQREVDEIRAEYEAEVSRIRSQYEFAPARVLASRVTVTHRGVSEPINFLLTDFKTEDQDSAEDAGLADFVKRMAEVYSMDAETAEFLYPLVEQYGFNHETVYLMYRIKQGIDEAPVYSHLPQNMKNMLFVQILGRSVYGGDDPVDTLKWNATTWPVLSPTQTVSPLLPYTGNMLEVYQQLGLSEEEANKLIYQLNLQHNLSGEGFHAVEEDELTDNKTYLAMRAQYEKIYGEVSDEKFKDYWYKKQGQYDGRTDFAHQAVTTATEQAMHLGMVKELSGWRGDVTKDAEADPSLGNDDYRADLDAVNIDRRMDENPSKSYLEVQADYYRDLREGKTNRATEFKTNVDYERVKQQVYQLSPYAERDGKYYRAEDAAQAAALGFVPPWIEEVPEEEVRNYVQKNYKDSYNFLRSLEEEDNDLGSYAGGEDQ